MSASSEPPAAIELLPIECGEHKTRQGFRAFVVRTDPALREAHGFIESPHGGRIHRLRKVWSLSTGNAIFSRGGRASDDLIARIDPRLTPDAAARWAEEHTALVEHWEGAKD